MEQTGCSASEPFALRVLGDSMAPEFLEGHIIIVDPGLPATHGAYVVVDYENDTSMRQYIVDGVRKFLHALNSAYPDIELEGYYYIHGVVVQRSTPGRRRETKHYV